MAPRVSMAEVARRHDLYPQQPYTWRRIFAGAAVRIDAPAPMFLPVEMAETRACGLSRGACAATDMRKGIAGLAAAVQEVLSKDPCSSAVFAFRGRRGD